MEHQQTELGKRIRKRRRYKKLKQYQLAEILDISNNHLSDLENGRVNISVDTLVKLCNSLEVTPDYLLMGSLHPNNVPQNIADSLRLCSGADQQMVSEIIAIMVERNQENWNRENFV